MSSDADKHLSSSGLSLSIAEYDDTLSFSALVVAIGTADSGLSVCCVNGFSILCELSGWSP